MKKSIKNLEGKGIKNVKAIKGGETEGNGKGTRKGLHPSAIPGPYLELL